MTLKQKLAVKKITEEHRSVSGAMRDVGYSPNTASKPSNLTDSKGWQKLMEKHLPDKKLLRKHEEALDAKKWNDFTGEREPDHAIRLRAIMEAHKLKGRLKDGLNVQGDMTMNVIIVRNANS